MTGRVIVLGGGGFIARHFVDEYRRRNTRVVIVDTRTPAFPLAGESFVMGDVRDPSTFEGLLEPGDSVLHLAAAHHDFGLTRETFFSVNAWGAEVLAQAMQRAGVVDCCFFSSVAVYGHGEGTHAEGDPCRPWSHYGASKLAAEQSLEEWACAAPDRRLLIVRPTMTFGEYNFANMYSLISQLHSGRYALVGQGRNRKSIAYVGNLVDAALQLWGAPRERVSVVNYADKPDLSSREIETLVAGALGRRMPPVKVPYPVARIMVTPFDAYTRLTGRDLGLARIGCESLPVTRRCTIVKRCSRRDSGRATRWRKASSAPCAGSSRKGATWPERPDARRRGLMMRASPRAGLPASLS